MPQESFQLLAKLDDSLVRRFKAELALDGLSYKDWLVEQIEIYIAKQGNKVRPRKAVQTPTRKADRKRGGVK